MKISFLSFFILFLAGIFIFSGCKTKTPKVGILIHSYENERWDKDKNYLVDDLTKLGAEVMLEVADNNQQKQIEQAATMIKNGAKVLILVPINQDEAAKIVEIAHEAGVKVIAYERLINGCKLDFFVASNGTQIGELQASSLISVSPKGKYALIGGSKYDNNSMRLFLGQINTLQPYMENGDIQVVYSEFGEEWSKEDGYRQAKIILTDNSDELTGIICGNDNQATGALMALKEKGLDGKILLAGQDAELQNVKEIMAGNQTSTILKPLKATAQAAADLAISLAFEKPLTMKFTTESNGKTLVKSILIDAILVNKNNIESTVIASGFHTSADLNR